MRWLRAGLVLTLTLVPLDLGTAKSESTPFTAPRVAVLADNGQVSVKSGALSEDWQGVAEGVAAIELAGNRIGLRTTDDRLLVNQGALSASFTELATGVRSIALSGDRIGFIRGDGAAFVKSSTVTAPWQQQAEGVRQLALSGNRIGVVTEDGTALVKEGDLTAPWVRVAGGVRQLVLSGTRVGVVDAGGAAAMKEGSLSAAWVRLDVDVTTLALEGGRIGVLKKTGDAMVKEGTLENPWVRQTQHATDLVLQGNRIGVVADGNAAVKEGGLSAPWIRQATGVRGLDLAQQARRVLDYGAACDGQADDASAIQTTIDAAQQNDLVEFPADRTCRFAGNLTARGKSRLTIRGAGMDSSRLAAADPGRSALRILGSAAVSVQDLELDSPGSALRSTSPDAAGLLISASREITVSRVRVRRAQQSGIFASGVRDARIEQSEIQDTRADGIHVTKGSANVTLRGNSAARTGDDAFASVTYQGQPRNENISILDNSARFSRASGIAVEGSKGVRVLGNYIYRSRVAGMRVSASSTYLSRGVDQAYLANNTLTRSPDNSTSDHPAILLYTNRQERITAITVHHNVIRDPVARFGVRLLRMGDGVIAQSSVQHNSMFMLSSARVCVSLSPGVRTTTVAKNVLNHRRCPN